MGASSRASARCANTTKPPALSSKRRGRLALHLIHLHVTQSSIMTSSPYTLRCPLVFGAKVTQKPFRTIPFLDQIIKVPDSGNDFNAMT